MKGTIKWFNATKGYGFIARQGETDVFLHVSAIQRAGIPLKNIKPSQPVEFDITKIEAKRPAAVNIRVPGLGSKLPEKFPWQRHIEAVPIYPHWHAVFRRKVLAAPTQPLFEREAVLATLEVVVRTARKVGWTVMHTSDHKQRVSSRYIKIPRVGICRVSNHDLLPRHKRYWNGEVIIKGDWRTVKLNDWMQRVRQQAKPVYE